MLVETTFGGDSREIEAVSDGQRRGERTRHHSVS